MEEEHVALDGRWHYGHARRRVVLGGHRSHALSSVSLTDPCYPRTSEYVTMEEVRFSFELLSDDAIIHGLALGHMSIHIGQTTVSSKDRDQSLMIFLSLVLLLDAVRT